MSDLEKGSGLPESLTPITPAVGFATPTDSPVDEESSHVKGSKQWSSVSLSGLRRRFSKGPDDVEDKHHHHRRRRDLIVSGERKKKSALHGTGASAWYDAKNWFYSLLDWSWTFVFFLITLGYIAASLLWGLVTWAIVDGVDCEFGSDSFLAGSFGRAMVFTTSNVLTIGFGPCMSTNYATYSVACLQQYCGLVFSVVFLSVVVSKFQIPKPDVIFSQKMLVTTRDGQPVLLFRIGNRRVNLLYETRVAVALLRGTYTTEGETFVEYLPLKVLFPPSMTAVATVVHRIDHKSPIRKFLVENDFEFNSAAFSVSFRAHDSIYHDELSCTTQYKGEDVEMGGFLFGDVMEYGKGGKRLRANFDKFNSLRETDLVTKESVITAITKGELVSELVPRGSAPATLVNDVTQEPVATSPPSKLENNVVYLCYGSMRCKNMMVRICPYSRFVYMFLVESGIHFRVIDIDWDDKPKWFLEKNPGGKTPFVYVRGKWVSNSRDIIRAISKVFREQTVSVNRPHPLPTSAFAFFELFEKTVFPVLLSSPQKLQEMLALEDEASSTNNKSTTSSNTRRRIGLGGGNPLYSERVRRSKPPLDAKSLYLVVAARHRGDRLTRFCPGSQMLELCMRLLDIPFQVVLVDVENRPDWVENGPPMLFGATDEYGSPYICHGYAEIMEWLSCSRFKAEFAKLPTQLGLCATLDLHARIMPVVSGFLLRRPGSEETLLQLLKTIQDLLLVEQKQDEGQTNTLPKGCLFCWAPFLSGTGQIGLEDVILAPSLFIWVKVMLVTLGRFDLAARGFKSLATYLSAITRTEMFSRTTMTTSPESFFISLLLPELMEKQQQVLAEKEVQEEAAVFSTMDLEMWNEQEKKCIHEIYSEYGKDTIRITSDGSISVEGGQVGPTLEMNTVYLAIGSVRRGEELVKVCPFSRVIEMAAIEAGIPHQVVLIDLLNKPEWFKKTSNGKAPNLYWNGCWHSESSVILALLQRLFPEKLKHIDLPVNLPIAELENKTKMELFNAADTIAEAFHSADIDDPERNDKRARLLNLLSAIETRLNDHPGRFLSGSTTLPCLDDIALICSLWRIVKVSCGWFHGFDLAREGFPRIVAWMTSFEKRESFTRSIPPYVESFLIYYNAKFHANQIIQMTPLIESNERDAISKSRLATSLSYQDNNADMQTLSRLEAVLGLLEEILQEDGPFICGPVLGLPDLLVFSSLKFFLDTLERHGMYSLKARGFPCVAQYVDLITNLARFREVLSPAIVELTALHFSARLASQYPHLSLDKEEKEKLEMVLLSKLETHVRRYKYTTRKGLSSTTSVASEASDETKPELDDLLFCI